MDIKFYDNSHDCITHFDKLSISEKIFSLTKSYITFFGFAIDKISSNWINVDKVMAKYTIAPSCIVTPKKRLIVCLHGLNSHPYQFKQIVNDMVENDLSNTIIYIPKIIQKGNAKLDIMIKPIFQEIKQWAQKNESQELILIGTSNGSRIAKALEAKLTSSTENIGNIRKIHFISIVGACKGSYTADLANKFYLSFLVSNAIAEEMPTNSKRIRQLHNDWIKGFEICPNIEREYTYIASPHDMHVPNKDSTLMKISKKENVITRYAIVPGHGHMSIVNAVSKIISELIFIPHDK